MEYDDIVVGGGSAGSIVAARLSEDRDRRVLLLEAGRDYPDREVTPAELLDARAAVLSGHNWDLEAYVREEPVVSALGRASAVLSVASRRVAPADVAVRPRSASDARLTRFHYPLAKVMGGGSATNGAMAFRGAPEDYDEWAAAGNDWWSWKKVRPELEALESATNGRGALTIETAEPESHTTLQRDFADACRSLGFPWIDLRRETGGGVGNIPKNTRNGERLSAAAAFLSPARRRQNLTIIPSCTVDRLILEDEERGRGIRVRGVEAFAGGKARQFLAKRVFLSAGAIYSPAILFRSGIGARDELRRLGIEPRIDLPGVGKNLQDHAVVAIWAVPKGGVCTTQEPVHQVMLRHTAHGSEHANDLSLFMLGAVRTETLPPLRSVTGSEVAFGVTVFLGKSRSRGRLEFLSRDHEVSPAIYLNCARDPEDVDRLADGVRLAWRILQQEPLRARVERLVMWNRNIVESQQQTKKLVASTVRSAWHPTGTLRMGPDTDPMAVVDHYGRLHGCENLRVADASIMPTIPRTPTNLACMMIGKRIAAHGLDER